MLLDNPMSRRNHVESVDGTESSGRFASCEPREKVKDLVAFNTTEFCQGLKECRPPAFGVRLRDTNDQFDGTRMANHGGRMPRVLPKPPAEVTR
jgi:hypothetical protein